MKPCILIPCYNHPGTVAEVAKAARAHGPVIIVDDGSTEPVPQLPDCQVIRLPENRGKGAALRAGFAAAAEAGFTHAITVDADGQHDPEYLPDFLAAAEKQPDAFILGVRDFYASGTPAGRRRSNAVSTFWFRVESGVRLGDTQCGFRCYPLDLVKKLRIRSSRYAYELEFMVRTAWLGVPIVPVNMVCTYRPEHILQSHFRPVLDLAHITIMNIGLVLQSWIVPRPVRIAWSKGERWGWLRTVKAFFSEHAHQPGRLACAVGLGLFCGIAPFWGCQMLVAGTLAHWLRLNKAIALVASNISIFPLTPFVWYSGLALGHWMFTGQVLHVAAQEVTRTLLASYLWQFLVGSVALGALVGVIGLATTYGVAKLWRHA